MEIKDKKGVKNMVADHLSQLKNEEVMKKEKNINEEFLDKHLMTFSERLWFANMDNYKATKSVPEDYTWQRKKHFYKEANYYLWNELYFFKVSVDGLIR